MDKLAIENFAKTFAKLKEFIALPIEDERDRAGVIQAFEFTYEQSWKSIQKLAARLGKNAAAPKLAFSAALRPCVKVGEW